MAAPTVIKWSDTGSPALTRTASSLINVLDYCLPQRGWVKEFSGTDKAVYRAGSGEQKFYRVLNDGSFYYSSTAYQYCHAKITAYDSMSDVDTGAGQWGEGYISVSNSGTAVPRPWVCVFSDVSVLLVICPHLTSESATANSLLFGFGETTQAMPGASARSFLGVGKLDIPLSNYCTLNCPGTYAPPYGAPVRCSRSIDGTRLGINTGLISNGGNVGVTNKHYPFGQSDLSPYSYPYNGSLLCARPLLDDGLAYSMGDYIPGLYYPLQKGTTLSNWGSYPDGDKTYIAVRGTAQGQSTTITNGSYIGAMLISTSVEDWS